MFNNKYKENNLFCVISVSTEEFIILRSVILAVLIDFLIPATTVNYGPSGVNICVYTYENCVFHVRIHLSTIVVQNKLYAFNVLS